MASPFKLGATLAACVLAFSVTSAFASEPTFDFSTVPSNVVDNVPLDDGTAASTAAGLGAPVTVGLTGSSGVTATFTDPNNSGNFEFSAFEAGFFPSWNQPVVLSETGSAGDTLDLSFSSAISGVQFEFSLGNMKAGDWLDVALYNGATLVGTIQDATTQTYSVGGEFSTGLFAYSGAAITSMVITGAVNPATGDQLASITLAPVPEPTTWALMGVGLLAVAGAARRRRAGPRSGDAEG